MIKIYDYQCQNNGWVEVESLEKARNIIKDRFHDYWSRDRDNWCEYYIEIYHDGEYEVWVCEAGGWYGNADENGPHKEIYSGKREEFSEEFDFTETSPRKDYIFVNGRHY